MNFMDFWFNKLCYKVADSIWPLLICVIQLLLKDWLRTINLLKYTINCCSFLVLPLLNVLCSDFGAATGLISDKMLADELSE